MASTNQTPNYGLPVYIGTDMADWMDTNTPFGLIDTAVKQASTDASNASSAVTTLSGTVSGHTTDITNLQGDVTSLQSQVNSAKTALGTSYNNATSGLTATDVQNAIDELKTNITDLIGEVTSDGVKTITQLFTSLYSIVSGSLDIGSKYTLTIEYPNGTYKEVFECTGVDLTSGLQFAKVFMSANNIVNKFAVIGSTPLKVESITTTGGTTFSDESSTVWQAGYKFRIYEHK